MLILTRYIDEEAIVLIPGYPPMRVVRVGKDKIGFDAVREIEIHRKEIYERPDFTGWRGVQAGSASGSGEIQQVATGRGGAGAAEAGSAEGLRDCGDGERWP